MSEPNGPESRTPLLELKDVEKTFKHRRESLFAKPGLVRAVRGVSFQLHAGDSLGLVGESGCGKSTLARLILGLIPVTDGVVRFNGEDISGFGRTELKALRRQAQMVFQDPHASLDPRMRLGASISAPLQQHKIGTRTEQRERVAELLERVDLSRDFADRYPHECSGGQLQRAGIARALVLDPDLIVCDEPTSALDVSVQAQVLNLLDELREDLGLTYVFISHDLEVVRHISSRIAVMYLGEIVEMTDADVLFDDSLHPYTQALISSIPSPEPGAFVPVSIKGEIPSPLSPPSGCSFHTRCPLAEKQCIAEAPPLTAVVDGHDTACWCWQEARERAGRPAHAAQ